MTIPIREGEAWDQADGAPDGPAFDIKVASKTRPDLTYRIVRQRDDGNGAGYILHSPACELWKFSGKRLCTHVRSAIALAESPEQSFLDSARASWERIGGALATGDDIHQFWTDTARFLSVCREIRLDQLGALRAKTEWLALTKDEQTAIAVATFGRGDPREAA